MKIEGKIVDMHCRQIYDGNIEVEGKIIKNISRTRNAPERYIMPGLIDSHIHIESSMATPGAFAAEAVSRGTIGLVSDPHEIANVLGIEGVEFMIRDAEKVPLKFWFGAPSCVPATSLETSGAEITADDVEILLEGDKIKFLAEVMNYPGVINDDINVLRKIESARKRNKKIDGHAPGLRGDMLRKYISRGITTDHECSDITEAREKLNLGMKIIIREGSAARNLNALKDLIRTNPEMVMLCSDDLHPEMLCRRHLDKIVAQLVKEGYDLFDVLKCCNLNPVVHYGLEAGTLKVGDPADFIVVNHPEKMDILENWINGAKVYENGRVLFNYERPVSINKFICSPVSPDQITVRKNGQEMRVILARDGELITEEAFVKIPDKPIIDTDKRNDILKIVVKDRYLDSEPATAFIRGFGLNNGAFASSVAHDCHNIICIGTNDRDIVAAVNELVRIKGGLSVSVDEKINSLSLPVAGIMSEKPVAETARQYEMLSDLVKSLGCTMSAPFMTLSFMALLVIPELKLGDKGLFLSRIFGFVPLFKE